MAHVRICKENIIGFQLANIHQAQVIVNLTVGVAQEKIFPSCVAVSVVKIGVNHNVRFKIFVLFHCLVEWQNFVASNIRVHDERHANFTPLRTPRRLTIEPISSYVIVVIVIHARKLVEENRPHIIYQSLVPQMLIERHIKFRRLHELNYSQNGKFALAFFYILVVESP